MLAVIEVLILGVSLMEVGLLQNVECFRESLLKNDTYSRRELKQSEDNTQIYVSNFRSYHFATSSKSKNNGYHFLHKA